MRKIILTIFLVIVLMAISQRTVAQDRGFGVGAAIGGPEGLSIKSWLGETSAISGLITFTISENTSSYYTHLDYLNHKFYDDLDWDFGRMFYYYGGGVGFEWLEWVDDTTVFLRLPSGFGFNFDDVPVDLFLELAPTFDVNPEFAFYFNGNFGFRFYLN